MQANAAHPLRLFPDGSGEPQNPPFYTVITVLPCTSRCFLGGLVVCSGLARPPSPSSCVAILLFNGHAGGRTGGR